MYAVIFRAQIASLDKEYAAMATRLRELALSEYGCRDFHAVCEDGKEIAVSYWDSLEQIRAWKQDPLHLQAQALGKGRWYSGYRVEVVEVLRHYRSESLSESVQV